MTLTEGLSIRRIYHYGSSARLESFISSPCAVSSFVCAYFRRDKFFRASVELNYSWRKVSRWDTVEDIVRWMTQVDKEVKKRERKIISVAFHLPPFSSRGGAFYSRIPILTVISVTVSLPRCLMPHCNVRR